MPKGTDAPNRKGLLLPHLDVDLSDQTPYHDTAGGITDCGEHENESGKGGVQFHNIGQKKHKEKVKEDPDHGACALCSAVPELNLRGEPIRFRVPHPSFSLPPISLRAFA